jgi:hypothetical protein
MAHDTCFDTPTGASANTKKNPLPWNTTSKAKLQPINLLLPPPLLLFWGVRKHEEEPATLENNKQSKTTTYKSSSSSSSSSFLGRPQTRRRTRYPGKQQAKQLSVH